MLSASRCEGLDSPPGKPSGKCSRRPLSEARVGSDVELRAVLLRARATSSGLEVDLKLLETPTTWLNAAPPELGEASRNSSLDLQPVFPIFRTPPGIDTPTLGGVFSLSGGEKQGRPCVHSPCPICPKEAHLPQPVLKSHHISSRRGPGHSEDQDYVNSIWAGEAVVLTPRVFTAPKGLASPFPNFTFSVTCKVRPQVSEEGIVAPSVSQPAHQAVMPRLLMSRLLQALLPLDSGL